MSTASRIGSAAVQLTLANGTVRLLSFVTMPFMTHLLLPQAYGIAAMAGTFIALVSVICLAGMDMSYVRAFPAYAPIDQQRVERLVWRCSLATGVMGSLTLMFCWKWIASAFSLPEYLAPLVGIGVFFSVANSMVQARARLSNRYRFLTLSAIASGIGTAAIGMGTAYWWRPDEVALMLSILAGYMIPTLLLGVPPGKQLVQSSGFDTSSRANILRIGLAGTLTAPGYWILSSSDRWFLGYFESQASVGIYAIGYTVGIVGMMANNAVTAVWTPEVVKEHEQDPSTAPDSLGALAERLVAAYVCVWLVVTAAGGDVIRLLAAPAFHDAAALVPFIAGGVFFYGISHLANASLLLVKKLDHAMWWWIAGGAVGLLANVVLIPRFGRLGAAVTQTLAFGVIAAGIVHGAQKHYPLALNWKRLAAVLAGTLAVGSLLSMEWTSSPITSLLLKFPIGALSTFMIVNAIAPEALPWIAKQLSGKRRLGQ